MTVFAVNDLATLKKYNDLGLVPRFNKANNMLQLEIKVMLIRIGSELDFLQVDDLLIFLGFVRAFALAVLEFPEVHDPANRRSGLRRHFHKIEVSFLSHVDRFFGEKCSHLLSVVTDDTDFPDSNHFIDALLIVVN